MSNAPASVGEVYLAALKSRKLVRVIDSNLPILYNAALSIDRGDV